LQLKALLLTILIYFTFIEQTDKAVADAVLTAMEGLCLLSADRTCQRVAITLISINFSFSQECPLSWDTA